VRNHRCSMRTIVLATAIVLVSPCLAIPPEEAAGREGPPSAPVASVPAAPVNEGVPILVAGREVVRLRAALGPFSAYDRAATATERIHGLVGAAVFDPGKIRAFEADGLMRVASGDQVLFTVLPEDLIDDGRAATLESANRIAAALRDAIVVDRAARNPKRLAISAALVVFVLLLVVVLFRLQAKAGRWARARVLLAKGSVLRGVHVRGLELISGDTLVTVAQKTVGFLQFILLLVVAYVAVSIVLSFFPWTLPYARASFGFVRAALWNTLHAVFGYIPNLFMIALIIAVIRYINRFVGFLFDAVGRGILVIPGLHPELAAPTSQISRWLVWILGLVVIFPYLPGSDSPAFQGIGVFVGLLISLGSSGAIGNFVAGIVLTYSRSFSVGDRVKIADTVGEVVAQGLLSTKVVTIKNEEVTIPNTAILSNHIVNYTELAEEKGLILHTTVTIGYDASWRTVHELLIAAARATEGVLAEPSPFVFQSSLDDFYVSYQINAYTRTPQSMVKIYSELHQNIQDQFNAAGVEIMSPHYAGLRDGNTVAIPSDKRAASYRPPSFRVSRTDGNDET